jgi:hypothetical protein
LGLEFRVLCLPGKLSTTSAMAPGTVCLCIFNRVSHLCPGWPGTAGVAGYAQLLLIEIVSVLWIFCPSCPQIMIFLFSISWEARIAGRIHSTHLHPCLQNSTCSWTFCLINSPSFSSLQKVSVHQKTRTWIFAIPSLDKFIQRAQKWHVKIKSENFLFLIGVTDSCVKQRVWTYGVAFVQVKSRETRAQRMDGKS